MRCSSGGYTVASQDSVGLHLVERGGTSISGGLTRCLIALLARYPIQTWEELI